MGERCFFLTGASGFVGREVLRAIVRDHPGSRVYATLRAPAGELEARAAAVGWRAFGPAVIPVQADLARTRLGLSPRDLGRVCAETTHVVHAGATVRFDDPLHRARQVNASGTREVVGLAARMPGLERVVHVSTTFVCGDRPGTLVEGPATAGRFRNTYERTKHEAEEIAQRAMATLPVTIVRPSIVGPAPAPDAAAGSTTRDARDDDARFLLLLRLYAAHRWRWVPGSPESLVDLVPVDLVARATVGLALRPLVDGRWYHLAAGPAAATLRDLGERAGRALRLPPLAFVPPRLLHATLRCVVWGRTRTLVERAAPFVPYLGVRTRVDTTDSHRVLRDLGLAVPRSADTFEALLARFTAAHAGGNAARRGADARPPARFSAARARAAAAPQPAERRS
jgi:nucleoside-diphosphate-sugar epimerase